MGELVEAALDAEVRAEREREDARVRREVAAGVVADEEHAAGLRDVVEPAHAVAAEELEDRDGDGRDHSPSEDLLGLASRHVAQASRASDSRVTSSTHVKLFI